MPPRVSCSGLSRAPRAPQTLSSEQRRTDTRGWRRTNFRPSRFAECWVLGPSPRMTSCGDRLSDPNRYRRTRRSAMLSALYDLARPMLFAFEPERAHELTLRSLEAGLYVRARHPDDPRLAVRLGGLVFPNPVGIAAGFDKDARVPDAVLGLGCGFAEVGTVTPKPQAGNPRPRVFRLVADRAIINRLGFNNGGHAAALRRLERRPPPGIFGVNIGANKDA